MNSARLEFQFLNFQTFKLLRISASEIALRHGRPQHSHSASLLITQFVGELIAVPMILNWSFQIDFKHLNFILNI